MKSFRGECNVSDLADSDCRKSWFEITLESADGILEATAEV